MQKAQPVVPTCLSFKKGYGRPCDKTVSQLTSPGHLRAPFNVTPGRGALFRVDVDLCGLCAKKSMDMGLISHRIHVCYIW